MDIDNLLCKSVEGNNVSSPVRVTATKAAGATTLTVESTGGMSTTTPIHFIAYELNDDEEPDKDTFQTFKGTVVDGTTIGEVTFRGRKTGTEAPITVTGTTSSYIVVAPTDAWLTDLIAGIKTLPTESGGVDEFTLTTDNNQITLDIDGEEQSTEIVHEVQMTKASNASGDAQLLGVAVNARNSNAVTIYDPETWARVGNDTKIPPAKLPPAEASGLTEDEVRALHASPTAYGTVRRTSDISTNVGEIEGTGSDIVVTGRYIVNRMPSWVEDQDVVQYSAQSLSNAEKTQARTNIDAQQTLGAGSIDLAKLDINGTPENGDVISIESDGSGGVRLGVTDHTSTPSTPTYDTLGSVTIPANDNNPKLISFTNSQVIEQADLINVVVDFQGSNQRVAKAHFGNEINSLPANSSAPTTADNSLTWPITNEVASTTGAIDDTPQRRTLRLWPGVLINGHASGVYVQMPQDSVACDVAIHRLPAGRGARGNTGNPGNSGADGSTSRPIFGRFTSAPSSPTVTSMTESNGVWGNLPNNWSLSPPSGAAPLYYQEVYYNSATSSFSTIGSPILFGSSTSSRAARSQDNARFDRYEVLGSTSFGPYSYNLAATTTGDNKTKFGGVTAATGANYALINATLSTDATGTARIGTANQSAGGWRFIAHNDIDGNTQDLVAGENVEILIGRDGWVSDTSIDIAVDESSATQGQGATGSFSGTITWLKAPPVFWLTETKLLSGDGSPLNVNAIDVTRANAVHSITGFSATCRPRETHEISFRVTWNGHKMYIRVPRDMLLDAGWLDVWSASNEVANFPSTESKRFLTKGWPSDGLINLIVNPTNDYVDARLNGTEPVLLFGFRAAGEFTGIHSIFWQGGNPATCTIGNITQIARV